VCRRGSRSGTEERQKNFRQFQQVKGIHFGIDTGSVFVTVRHLLSRVMNINLRHAASVLCVSAHSCFNKSSAIAEMDDHLATIGMARKVGGCCAPFHGESWIPSNTMSAWAEAYLHTKWHPDPSNRLATIHQRYR